MKPRLTFDQGADLIAYRKGKLDQSIPSLEALQAMEPSEELDLLLERESERLRSILPALETFPPIPSLEILEAMPPSDAIALLHETKSAIAGWKCPAMAPSGQFRMREITLDDAVIWCDEHEVNVPASLLEDLSQRAKARVDTRPDPRGEVSPAARAPRDRRPV